MNLLGSKVKDKITGFHGTVIGQAEYTYDAAALLVLADTMKDGKPAEPVWLPTDRCEILERESRLGFRMEAP